jgi:hypothetical protein
VVQHPEKTGRKNRQVVGPPAGRCGVGVILATAKEEGEIEINAAQTRAVL